MSSPSLGAQDGLRGEVEPAVRDDHVRARQAGHGAHAGDAPLGVIGGDDESATGLDEGLVGLRLEQVRRGEAGSLGHAVDAQEDDVHVDVAQRTHGEGPHEGIGGRAYATGEDDGLVAAATVVEDLRRRDRVGDDGEARHPGQTPGDLIGGAAGRDGHGHAGLHQGRSAAGDGHLGLVFQGALRVEARLVHRGLTQQGRAAVDLEEMPLPLEHLEVAAHGHVRDIQGTHELGHAHRSVSAQSLQDVGVSLWCQHGPVVSPCSLSRSCRRILWQRTTEVNEVAQHNPAKPRLQVDIVP